LVLLSNQVLENTKDLNELQELDQKLNSTQFSILFSWPIAQFKSFPKVINQSQPLELLPRAFTINYGL
jgi:hypothetical protein